MKIVELSSVGGTAKLAGAKWLRNEVTSFPIKIKVKVS